MGAVGLGLISALAGCPTDGTDPAAPSVPTYSLLLEWPTQDGLRYRVYRDQDCTQPGPLPTVIATVPTSPYRDDTVSKQFSTVCYELSAVDQNGTESAHSARVTGRMP